MPLLDLKRETPRLCKSLGAKFSNPNSNQNRPSQGDFDDFQYTDSRLFFNTDQLAPEVRPPSRGRLGAVMRPVRLGDVAARIVANQLPD